MFISFCCLKFSWNCNNKKTFLDWETAISPRKKKQFGMKLSWNIQPKKFETQACRIETLSPHRSNKCRTRNWVAWWRIVQVLVSRSLVGGGHRRKGKGRRFYLGDRIYSIPCRANYFVQCKITILKNRINSSFTSNQPGAIHPILQIVLDVAGNWINAVFQTEATTFGLASVFILLLWCWWGSMVVIFKLYNMAGSKFRGFF